MKTSRLVIYLLLVGLIALSCSKSSSPTPVSVSRGTLLAGASGSSKTWQLTSITEVDVSGGNSQTYNATSASGIPACESDNLFTFTNNSTQDYVQTEGATQCNVGGNTDPSTLEKGSWAITSDGNNLLIDGLVYPTSVQFQNEDASGYFLYYFILNIGEPITISAISSTSLTLTYKGSYTDSTSNQLVNYTVTLIFAAKS